MKILHVFDHSLPLQSGYTFRSRNILNEQRNLGWETFHLTSPKHRGADSHAKYEDVDGLRFHRTPRIALPLSWIPGLRDEVSVRKTSHRLAELAKEIEPDVIQAHSPVLNALAALPVARRLGIPLIYEVRAFWEDAAIANGTAQPWGPQVRLTRLLENHALASVQAITTICDGLKSDMVARSFAASSITVIPNAVDVKQFTEAPAADASLRVELGLDGSTVLGFIGSFYPYEGLDIAIRTLRLLAANDLNVKLLLVGGGPDEKKLKQLAESQGLGDRVIFTGRVPHDRVPQYAALIDIFVFPRKSIRLTELVTPLKPLEAMAQRKLVVASDVGGHRELIRDGETGILFAPDSPGALAECVEALLENRGDWARYVDAGRAFVERERTWAHSVANYKQIFDGLGLAV